MANTAANTRSPHAAQRPAHASPARTARAATPAPSVRDFDDDVEFIDSVAEFVDDALERVEATLPLPPVIEEYTAEDYLTDELIPMPSGKGLRVAKLSLISLVRSGQVPPNLLHAARSILKLDDRADAAQQQAAVSRQQRREQERRGGQHTDAKAQDGQPATNEDAVRLVDWVVCQVVRSFRVVDKVQEDCERGEVSIARILDPDKTAVFNYVLEGQTALQSFR